LRFSQDVLKINLELNFDYPQLEDFHSHKKHWKCSKTFNEVASKQKYWWFFARA